MRNLAWNIVLFFSFCPLMEATGFSWAGSASSGLAADDLVSSSSGTATYAEVFAESHSFSTVLQIK